MNKDKSHYRYWNPSSDYTKQKEEDRKGINRLILILLLIVLSSVIENWVLS
jgi:hypothetical protein